MTERTTTMEAGGLVRWLSEEGQEGRCCWAALPAPAGTPSAARLRCGRTAVVEVYGLSFCEAHGAEVRASALAEVYFDAQQFLARLDNPQVRADNSEDLRVLRAGVSELNEAVIAANEEDDAALLRAYPFNRDLMDEDFRDFDYGERGPAPEDWCRDHRMLLCKLLRLAYQEGAAYVVEALEPEREHVSAQLAYVMADYEERVGKPIA